MNILKFSHDTYLKLQNIDGPEVLLLEVFLTKKEYLSESFINYDTEYVDETVPTLANYKLPEGELLVLLFKDRRGTVFTTVRNRYSKNNGNTFDKLPYYRSKRDQFFKLEFVNG